MSRRSRQPSSLTWRIARLLTLVVLIGGALTAVVGTLGIRHLLVQGLDQQLSGAASQHETRMPHNDKSDGGAGSDNPEPAASAAPPSASDGTDNPGPSASAAPSSASDANSTPADLRLPIGTITGTISSGKVTSAEISRSSTSVALSTEAVAELNRHVNATSPTSVDVPGLGDYRIVVNKTDDGTLLTGIPQTGLNHTLTQVVWLEVLTVGLAALAMASAGALGVRRAMRPLRQVADTARDVSHTPLEHGAPQLAVAPAPSSATREVRDVTDALAAMLTHVQSSLRRRDASEQQLRAFIADASHELRTPVAIVRSHAELIEETIADHPVPERVESSLARIRSESRRMSHIVGDLLLLARLDRAPEMQLGEVDLSLHVLEVVDGVRVTAQDHVWGIDLPDEPVVVRADGDHLHRAILNLVANAARHTPAGTRVQVSLSQEGESARVTVHDDGPGIPDDVQSTLGQRFSRSRVRPRPDSTGLGLALVVAIAHAHGGDLVVHSTPGDTTVELTVPVDGPSATSDGNDSPSESARN